MRSEHLTYADCSDSMPNISRYSGWPVGIFLTKLDAIITHTARCSNPACAQAVPVASVVVSRMCVLRVCLLAAHHAQQERCDPLFRPAGSIRLRMCEWQVWIVKLVVEYEDVQFRTSLIPW
jgi:hypothetical protein